MPKDADWMRAYRANRAAQEKAWEKSGIKVFHSDADFDKWSESFDEAYEEEQTPVLVYTKDKKQMDMTTECKPYKTALRRFEKYFQKAYPDIKYWIEGMEESCENGYFSDAIITSGRDMFAGTDEEWREYVREQTNGGKDTYSWGVEELDSGRWYVYLNVRGGYN